MVRLEELKHQKGKKSFNFPQTNFSLQDFSQIKETSISIPREWDQKKIPRENHQLQNTVERTIKIVWGKKRTKSHQ